MTFVLTLTPIRNTNNFSITSPMGFQNTDTNSQNSAGAIGMSAVT